MSQLNIDDQDNHKHKVTLNDYFEMKDQIKILTYSFIAFFCVLIAWTSFYTVSSDSVAIVQRFGKYTKTISPGLHMKIPLGIDIATIVPIKRQLKQEFGFSTPGAHNPGQSPLPRDAMQETRMVTGDLNAALVEWVIQYRISNPVNFLFEVRQPAATLRYVSESVMREVVGDRTADEKNKNLLPFLNLGTNKEVINYE